MNTGTENYYGNENGFLLFLGVVILIILIATVIWFKVITPFLRERDYIKREIRRSLGDKDEYEYYQQELKALYLRSIPLIGKFFKVTSKNS